MPVVLGLDTSARKVGYAVGDGSVPPEADAFIFPPVEEDYGVLAEAFDECLTALVNRTVPALVCVEAPILVPGDTIVKVRKLYGVLWQVALLCHRRGVPYREKSLRQVKKELAGFAGAQKADMVAVAERLGVRLPETQIAGREDAADAVAVWLLGLRDVDKRASAEWDHRLANARGGLL